MKKLIKARRHFYFVAFDVRYEDSLGRTVMGNGHIEVSFDELVTRIDQINKAAMEIERTQGYPPKSVAVSNYIWLRSA